MLKRKTIFIIGILGGIFGLLAVLVFYFASDPFGLCCRYRATFEFIPATLVIFSMLGVTASRAVRTNLRLGSSLLLAGAIGILICDVIPLLGVSIGTITDLSRDPAVPVLIFATDFLLLASTTLFFTAGISGYMARKSEDAVVKFNEPWPERFSDIIPIFVVVMTILFLFVGLIGFSCYCGGG